MAMPAVVLAAVFVVGMLLAGQHEAHLQRREALYHLLERAQMLHAAVDRHRFAEGDTQSREPAVQRAIERELFEQELMGGYLAHTCIYDPQRVSQMHTMMAWIGVMRALGYTDEDITAYLLEQAGSEHAQLERLIRFAGLDGISHFLCEDYMRAALDAGIDASTLHAYIDRIH